MQQFVILTSNVYKSCQNLWFTHQNVYSTNEVQKEIFMNVFFANLVYPTFVRMFNTCLKMYSKEWNDSSGYILMNKFKYITQVEIIRCSQEKYIKWFLRNSNLLSHFKYRIDNCSFLTLEHLLRKPSIKFNAEELETILELLINSYRIIYMFWNFLSMIS